jgi:addiction module HigA family antidote
MTDKRLAPIHPGEILEEEFMRPLGLSANALAKAVDVPVTRVSEIVRGRRGVTADTALRLGRFLGTSPELWLGLQSEYDLRLAKQESGPSIESRVVPLKAAARRYENPRDSGATSEVREATRAYVSRGQTRARDRRRVRRTS